MLTRARAVVLVVFSVTAGAAWSVVDANADHGLVEHKIFTGAQMPQEVRAAFERSCQDCHSENTYWPLYSKLPVLHELIEADVAKGRKFMNLSAWENYRKGQKIGFLTAIGSAIHKGMMPPPRYTAIHYKATLSDAECDAIAKWSKVEIARIALVR